MIVAIKGIPNRAFQPWHRKETDKLQLATQNVRDSQRHAFCCLPNREDTLSGCDSAKLVLATAKRTRTRMKNTCLIYSKNLLPHKKEDLHARPHVRNSVAQG